MSGALSDPDGHAMVKQVRDYAAATFGAEAVVISARIEEEMIDLSPEDAAEFLGEIGVTDSGVSALIRAVYHLLGLRTYLTTGEKERNPRLDHHRRHQSPRRGRRHPW